MVLRPALSALSALLLLAALLPAAESTIVVPSIVVHSGDKIGFMGDSITAQGDAPDGYIGLVVFALKVEGVEVAAIPAGVPGHTSGNMRSRVPPQILDQGATWMTLSCGVNDVLMQAKGRGVELPAFQQNVTAMVEAAIAKKVKVVLLTPTPVGEDLNNENNAKLARYVGFMRDYATQHRAQGVLLADINAAFRERLATPLAGGEVAGKRLLADGVHPNKTGQALMARTVLLALGVPAADLPKIDRAQQDNPRGKGVKISGRQVVLISPNQYAALLHLSDGRSGAVTQILDDLWATALKQAGAGAEPTAEQKAAAQDRLGALVEAKLGK